MHRSFKILGTSGWRSGPGCKELRRVDARTEGAYGSFDVYQTQPSDSPSRSIGSDPRSSRYFVAIALAMLATCGCARNPGVSVIRLVDHREPGKTERFRESFSEAWYRIDDHGNIDLVLRRSGGRHNGDDASLTQLVHVRTIWRPVPGRTVSNRTQINATITYFLVSGRTGTAYDGAGSVFFRKKRDGRLVGAIEHAQLNQTRRLASSSPLFARAEVSGEFTAIEDPQRVIRLVNEMNQLFGPPAHWPRTTIPTK